MAAIRYKIAVDTYPRFKHFHDRLASIISRLENLEAVGNFASCISMGQEKFDDIVNVTKQLLRQEICLTVVPNEVKLPLTDDFVSRLRVGDAEATMSMETIKEEGVVDDMRSLSKFHPHFVVFLSTSSMSTMQEKNKHLLTKANDQRDNIIVHDMTSSTTYSYLELADPKLTREAKESSKILKTVGLKIQHMLEDRAVEILETMVVFNENFAPRDGQDMDLTISRECSSQVCENFDNQHIISDLDPEKNGVILRKKEAKGKEASAQKLVTPVLTTNEDDMETDGEPLEPQQKHQFTEEELEEIFYEKFIEFLCKKTKCITCDHLAQKFGISGSLVNEFLNEGYFSFEENYRKAVETMRRLKWSAVSKCSEGSMVQYDYIMRQTSFLRAAEEYVQEKVKMLAEFGKMNFEIYGLLRQARVQVFLKKPDYRAIPREMSDDLLGLGEVVGCGTIYGKLTIHIVNGQPLLNHVELKENISKILSAYGHPLSFRLQNLLETQSYAAGVVDPSISAGDELLAKLTDEEYERLKKEKEEEKKKTIAEMKKQNKKIEIQDEPQVVIRRDRPGSLGCYIGLREKEKKTVGMGDKASDAGEDMKVDGGGSNADRRAQLYGITCAHCVTGCHPNIQARCADTQSRRVTDRIYRDFGNTEYVLDEGQKIDIAAIRVTMDQNNCNSDISLSRWDFYTGKAEDLHLVADVVYKHGAASNTTEGIIVTNDYRSDIRENLRDALMEEANADKTRNFDPEFNILIDILAAQGLPSPQLFASNNPMVPQQQSSDVQAPGEDIEMQIEAGRHPEWPTFTHPLTPTAHVKAGADVTMECRVNGYPRPKVVWYRGQQVLSSSGSVRIETVEDRHMMIISRTSQLDAGSYRAVASNSAGQAESMCNLQVKMPVFSEPGDSGSVVYYHNIDDNQVRLASLLCGNIVTHHDIHGRLEFSYSCHLKKSLDALCDKYNLEIVMPWDVA